MDAITIQMIIDGCLVNNEQARYLLFNQVFEIGMPVARTYSRSEQDALETLEYSYLHMLENLEFYDASKLNFKGWVKQVVIDQGLSRLQEPGIQVRNFQVVAGVVPGDTGTLNEIQQLPPLEQGVFALQALEGYNQQDIGYRLNIAIAEVDRLFQKAVRKLGFHSGEEARFLPIGTIPEQSTIDTSWQNLLPGIREKFSTDETAGMPVRALSKERVINGDWIGWAVLLYLIGMSMVIMGKAGIVQGNKIEIGKAPVSHISSEMGLSLPCPNH